MASWEGKAQNLIKVKTHASSFSCLTEGEPTQQGWSLSQGVDLALPQARDSVLLLEVFFLVGLYCYSRGQQPRVSFLSVVLFFFFFPPRVSH